MNKYIEQEVAIKALMNDAPEKVSYSREDAADCIRHMDAADIECCGKLRGVTYEDGKVTAVYIRDTDDAVKVFTPVQHWVLTDEKLPPDGQEVLCWYEYFRYGAFNRIYQTYGIGFQFNGNWGGEVANGKSAKVLAWMPLPPPEPPVIEKTEE